MCNWYTTLLDQARNPAWIEKNTDRAIGLLTHGIVDRACRRSRAQREAFRAAFNALFDCTESILEQSAENKRKVHRDYEIQEHISGVNALFFLVNQVKQEYETIFFAPMICEYLTLSYSIPETKESLIKKMLTLIEKSISTALEKAILSTLNYLFLSGHTLPTLPKSKFIGIGNSFTQRSVYLQNAHPNMRLLLGALGFPLLTISRTVPNKESQLRKKSLGKAEIDGNQKESSFLSLLKEALKHRIVGLLEKEKDLEVAKGVAYYERLALGDIGSAKKVSLEMMQYCVAWSRDKSDFKKAFIPYIAANEKNPPPFVVIYTAYSMIKCSGENIDEEKSLKETALSFFASSKALFLDSFALFLSLFSIQSEGSYTLELFSYFYALSIDTDAENLSLLSSMHKKYPWLLGEPCVISYYFSLNSQPQHQILISFLAKELVLHEHLDKIKSLDLVAEAICAAKQILLEKNGASLKLMLESLESILPTATAQEQDIDSLSFEQFCSESAYLSHIHILVKKYTQNYPHLKPLILPLFDSISLEEQIEVVEKVLCSFSPSTRPAAYLAFLHCAILLETPLSSLFFSTSTLQRVV